MEVGVYGIMPQTQPSPVSTPIISKYFLTQNFLTQITTSVIIIFSAKMLGQLSPKSSPRNSWATFCILYRTKYRATSAKQILHSTSNSTCQFIPGFVSMICKALPESTLAHKSSVFFKKTFWHNSLLQYSKGLLTLQCLFSNGLLLSFEQSALENHTLPKSHYLTYHIEDGGMFLKCSGRGLIFKIGCFDASENKMALW